MLKVYELNCFGSKYLVAPIIHKYIYTDVLAVDLIDVETGEDFGMLTVNLIDENIIDATCSFVDTNNIESALSFIRNNKLAEHTGFYGVSGFCIYPLYKFDLSKLNTEEELKSFYKDGEFNA